MCYGKIISMKKVMMFIICLFLCGCSSASSSRKVYNEYVDTLKGVKEEKMHPLIEVIFKVINNITWKKLNPPPNILAVEPLFIQQKRYYGLKKT